MFHMPMSSPMMTTMLGFCCCCAEAGKNAPARTMLETSALDISRRSFMFQFSIDRHLRAEFTQRRRCVAKRLPPFKTASLISQIARSMLCSFGKLGEGISQFAPLRCPRLNRPVRPHLTDV